MVVGETHHFRKHPYHKLARNKSLAILVTPKVPPPKKIPQIGSRNLKFLDCSGNERAGHLVKDLAAFFFQRDHHFDQHDHHCFIIIIIIIIIIMPSMILMCDPTGNWISSIRMEVSDHHDGFTMASWGFDLARRLTLLQMGL